MAKEKMRNKINEGLKNIPFSRNNILYLFIIITAVFSAFSPSLKSDFVKWDDDWYVLENRQFDDLGIDGITKIFSEFYNGQYSPVSTVIVGFQYITGSKSPFFLHLGGILIHILNTILVFYFTFLLFKKSNIALFVAVLFGIHSMQAEPVAWISAQKVLIFSAFFLLSLISYLKYLNSLKLKYYLLSLLYFVLSAFSKEQAVVLPICLIAIDYFHSRKLLTKKIVLEKVPFFAISIIFGIITIYASRTGKFYTDDTHHPIIQQIVYASFALTHYITNLIFPYKLSAFHPYPGSDNKFPLFIIPHIFTTFLILYFLIRNIKKNKVVSFAILFFAINISLVLQLMPLRDFITADRYVYLPSLGLFFIASYYFFKAIENNKNKKLFYGIFIVYSIILMSISYNQTSKWKNSISLFTDVVKTYPECSLGWTNKGLAMFDEGRYEEAIVDYEKAIEYNSLGVFAYNNMGLAYSAKGDQEKAISLYSKAIEMRPDLSQAYYNRADAYSKTGDSEKSIEDYTKYISLNPSSAKAYISRGIVIAKSGNFSDALSDLNQAILLDNKNPQAFLNRGVIYLNLRNFDAAINDFNSTLRFRPDFDYAIFNRGIARIQNNDNQGGCEDLYKAYNNGFKQAAGAINQFCK